MGSSKRVGCRARQDTLDLFNDTALDCRQQDELHDSSLFYLERLLSCNLVEIIGYCNLQVNLRKLQSSSPQLVTIAHFITFKLSKSLNSPDSEF